MELQGIAAPCSAQQLCKVAQRCARSQFFNFLYFELIGHDFLAPAIDSQDYFCNFTLRWPIFGGIEVSHG